MCAAAAGGAGTGGVATAAVEGASGLRIETVLDEKFHETVFYISHAWRKKREFSDEVKGLADRIHELYTMIQGEIQSSKGDGVLPYLDGIYRDVEALKGKFSQGDEIHTMCTLFRVAINGFRPPRRRAGADD